MKYRILHFPQYPCEPFIKKCTSIEDARRISEALADYDLFLYQNNHRCDYANMQIIEYFDAEEQEWLEYEEE